MPVAIAGIPTLCANHRPSGENSACPSRDGDATSGSGSVFPPRVSSQMSRFSVKATALRRPCRPETRNSGVRRALPTARRDRCRPDFSTRDCGFLQTMKRTSGAIRQVSKSGRSALLPEAKEREFHAGHRRSKRPSHLCSRENATRVPSGESRGAAYTPGATRSGSDLPMRSIQRSDHRSCGNTPPVAYRENRTRTRQIVRRQYRFEPVGCSPPA